MRASPTLPGRGGGPREGIAELEKAHAEQVEAMRCKFEKQIGALEQENSRSGEMF